jgi:hypothetical protein
MVEQKGSFAMKKSVNSPEPSDGVQESDVRLKQDVTAAGALPDGLKLYKFRYLWDETEYVGVMAQDVLKVRPDAVSTGEDGFYRVNYAKLGTRMMTAEEWYKMQAETGGTDASTVSPEPIDNDSDIRMKRGIVEVGYLSPEPKPSDTRIKRDVFEVGYLLLR